MTLITIGRLLNLPIKSLIPCQRCSPLLSQLIARNYSLVKRYSWLVKDGRFSAQSLLLHANRLSMLSPNYYLFSQSKNGEKERSRTPKDVDRGSSSEDSDKQNDKDDGNDPDSQKEAMLRSITTFALLLCFTFVLLAPMGSPAQPPNREISWNEFYHNMLARGEVEQLVVQPHLNQVTVHLHPGANIIGKSPWIRTYYLHVADTESFERKLRKAEQELGISPDNGVPMVYERKQDNSLMILLLLILVGLYIFSLKQTKGTAPGGNMFSKLTRAKFTVVDSLTGAGKGVKFSDVAGLKEAKVEILEFVDYLKSSEKYSALGAKVPKGVLLLGPPGCGKTMLAKAVASEANVPFLAMAGTEFIEMIGGLGAARVRDLFSEARKRAPCIVYIDEIDSIGRKRSNTSTPTSGEEEQTLNQLLVEMDGMAGREGVILLASTNRAEILDKALLRPGRFDRHILIDLPTLEERKEMFEKYLAKIKLSIEPEKYYARLASLTPGFSGADIANVCNEAALNAARYKRNAVIPSDLEYAVERVIGGMEKKSQVLSPHEKKVVAYHESGHALVGWLMKHTDALLKVTIVPRTNNVLGFAQYSQTDQKLYSKEELFDKMCMVLGGRVAESIIFNRISTGAQDDLKKVTKMAYAQIKQFGMDNEVGLLSFSDEGSFMPKPYSKQLGNLIDLQARRLVAQAYKVTEKLLLENKDKLKSMAEELLEREVLNYKDVERLIGPPPHGSKKIIPELDLLVYDGQDATTTNQDSAAKDSPNGDSKQP